MLNSSDTENLRGLGECNRADHRIGNRNNRQTGVDGCIDPRRLDSFTTLAIDGFVKSCHSDN
jgi:hypothetical protein